MRGFRVRSSLISDPRLFSRLRGSFLRPSAEHMSACGRHPAKALRRTREKTSGTRGSENYKKPYFICFHYQFSCLGNEQSSFLFVRRAKRDRHKWSRAWLKARDGRDAKRFTLTHAYTPWRKIETARNIFRARWTWPTIQKISEPLCKGRKLFYNNGRLFSLQLCYLSMRLRKSECNLELLNSS